ncbi:hypothetical protein GCM10011500_09600 [Mucilaginibacter rubeus]|nr:hypothetical protein GCM10011500_09600 [Mucilaginibacter rubeus]
MICDLFNEIYTKPTYKLFGKNGHQQKGIDIFSNDSKVVVQCKLKDLNRSKSQLKREFLADIEDTIDKLIAGKPKISFDTVFIVTTLSEDPDFDEHCEALRKEKGLPSTVICWGWETIQEKLGLTNKTLQKHYPNYIHKQMTNEELVKSRIKMKTSLERDFGLWLNFSADHRTRASSMILHSIDDKDYPVHVYNSFDEPQWFRVEIDAIYHSGIGFITGIDTIYWLENQSWTKENVTGSIAVKVAVTEIVAFEDIISYTLKGDDKFACPHFYSRFDHKGRPFIETFYKKLAKQPFDLPLIFDKSNQNLKLD